MTLPTFTQLAELSSRAYRARPTVRAHDCEVLVEHLEDDLVAVAFRGTSGFADAWMDARAAPWYDTQLGLGWCHRGFLLGVQAVWPVLLPLLLGMRVAFAGHSKGGAEASLACAAACRVPGIYPVMLGTFGAARCVAGSRVEKIINGRRVRHGRFTERGDPVPGVPPYLRYPGGLVVELGEAWDSSPDHPVKNYVADVMRWEVTDPWSEVLP